MPELDDEEDEPMGNPCPRRCKRGKPSSQLHLSPLRKRDPCPLALAQRAPYHRKLEKLTLEHKWSTTTRLP
jgi:hypothetical protein